MNNIKGSVAIKNSTLIVFLCLMILLISFLNIIDARLKTLASPPGIVSFEFAGNK